MFQLLVLLQILFIPDILCISKINFSDREDGLVSVAVIFRHGDRTPLKPYPKDPYRYDFYWPVAFGQLTNIGKMQQFELGQWLRNRYRNFLPDQYSKKDFYIRSTDVDRTLMSAQANLAGLFPPRAGQIWNKNLNWQPIPIHTTPKQFDNIVSVKMPCPKSEFLLDKLLKSPEFVQIDKENQDLYAYISRNSGAKIASLKGLQYIYNVLTVETLYNFTLPKWTKRIFPKKIKPGADRYFAIRCYTPDLARLKIGPLLNDILDRFTNVARFKGQKFFMYSGHDTTIANILNALNVFDYHSPPYAATILLELRSLNGSFFVNILYKNTSIPQQIVLKGCEYYCPLEKFEKILEPIRLNPKEWEDECRMKVLEISPFTSVQSTTTSVQNTVFIIFGGTLCFVLITYVMSVFCVKMIRKERQQGYAKIP